MKQFLVLALLLVAAWYLSPLLFPADHVIDDVVMFTDERKAVIEVHFSSPIRFEGHSPEGNSLVLQVRMRPVAVSSPRQREVVPRDSFKSDVVRKTSLAAISYEGDVPGGPLLTFLFARPVDFSVAMANAMQTLRVEIPVQGEVTGELSRG